ncbi:MAG: hypothetical protein P8163_22855 [Candidatus Thiodiazotropha sp.]
MPLHKNIFVLILLALILSDCGGGGGGGDGSINEGGGDDSTPDTTNINGGLTGRLFVDEEGQGWVIDLATGISSVLPSKSWWDTGDYDGYNVYFDAFPNHDGSEFLLYVDGCYREFEGKEYDYDCLTFINSAGDLLTSRIVFDDGILSARQSRDGNYVAIAYADEYYVGPTAYLLIYNRNITERINQSAMRRVSTGNEHRYKAGSIDWAPNGQIVYIYAKTIFITSPYSTDSTPLLTLPDSDEPYSDDFPVPATARVSPDGSKVAFRYVTETNLYQSHSTIWVVNIDGTDLHQLAHNPAALYQMFNDVAWSPDGKYILTKSGGFSSDVPTAGAESKLYAIPSSSRNVPLDCDGPDGIICVRTYHNSPDRLTDELSTYETDIINGTSEDLMPGVEKGINYSRAAFKEKWRPGDVIKHLIKSGWGTRKIQRIIGYCSRPVEPRK